MKHAFIMGTSVYLTERNTLSYADGDANFEFLRILSFYRPEAGSVITIDANIETLEDHHPVKIAANAVQEGNDVRLDITSNRVRVYHAGHVQPILDVYQLEQHEYHGLSSHILNEIHSQHPDHVITIKGNFKVAGAHIEIENEKMFIDADSIANGVNNAHEGIMLSSSTERVHQ